MKTDARLTTAWLELIAIRPTVTDPPDWPWLDVEGQTPRGRGLVMCLALFCVLTVPDLGVAQTSETEESSLLERYRAAHQRLVVRRQLLQQGGLDIFPIVRIPTSTDSLRPPPPEKPATAEKPSSVPVDRVRPVRRLERDWFRQRFDEVQWSFLGSTPDHTFFDTTRTRDLRGRLQAAFGDPTQTLVDLEAPLDTSQGERAQFEYWFVVNDSMPVQVTDVRGPSGRGLILAAEREYRDRLQVLRDTLLAPVRQAERAPYVDYYYEGRRNRWYRTGFDGSKFFRERIAPSTIVPGRRPRLDSTRTTRPDRSSEDNGSR